MSLILLIKIMSTTAAGDGTNVTMLILKIELIVRDYKV